jgi:hypothetical protein
MAALIQINELKQRVAVSFDRTERSYDNALQYILILALLVLVFITFGEILGSVTGYCSDKRKRPSRRGNHRRYRYPSHSSLITDND